MKRNVGGADKVIRFLVAAIALVVGIAALTIPLHIGWAFGGFAVAVIAGLTATVGFCPINQMLGIDTCSAKTGTGTP